MVEISPDFRTYLDGQQAFYSFMLEAGAELVDQTGDEPTPIEAKITRDMVAYANIATTEVALGNFTPEILTVAGKALGNEPAAVAVNIDENGNLMTGSA